MAKLVRHYNKKAKMVEEWIETLLADGYGEGKTRQEDWERNISSTPWVNGREKGFCFHAHANPEVYCFVAEARNSDALTITVGNLPDWDCITDEQYGARIFLEPDDYERCAVKVMKLCLISPTSTETWKWDTRFSDPLSGSCRPLWEKSR
tara:strand:- start:237 stop:686 length:450 start_codon:yes stop_codon:yes gene_type:complete